MDSMCNENVAVLDSSVYQIYLLCQTHVASVLLIRHYSLRLICAAIYDKRNALISPPPNKTADSTTRSVAKYHDISRFLIQNSTDDKFSFRFLSEGAGDAVNGCQSRNFL